jgi:hypothetical protein
MRLFICILFSSFMLPAVAQQRHFEQNIGWRGSYIELHTISDKNKQQSCTFIVSQDSIRALVFNNQVQLVQQFSFPRTAGQKIQGGFIRDGKVYLFTQGGNNEEFHNRVLDITAGTTKDRLVPFELNKQKVVDHLSGGDRFIYLTSSNKTKELIIYSLLGEEQVDTLRYQFNAAAWDDLSKTEMGGYKVTFEKVDMEGECPVYIAYHANKLYLHRDTLLLVMNDRLDSTQVYSFDLTHKKVNNWLIQHQAHPNTDNTFILDDQLFYVGASIDSLCLQIADLYSGAIKHSFVARAEDTISFKNTPVIQKGGFYIEGNTRELSKTKQILRNIKKSYAVIAATVNSNGQLELVVGAYEKMSSTSSVPVVTMHPGAGGTMVMMPTGGFYRHGSGKAVRFKVLLNARTLEHIDGVPGNSINEKIDYYTGGIKIPPHAENLFMTNGRYYHAYYDKNERKLVILKF